MVQFSATEVEEFRKDFYKNKDVKYKHLRVGQSFHQYFKLEKITGEDKTWCDKLYQKDKDEAWNLIMEAVDHNQ